MCLNTLLWGRSDGFSRKTLTPIRCAVHVRNNQYETIILFFVAQYACDTRQYLALLVCPGAKTQWSEKTCFLVSTGYTLLIPQISQGSRFDTFKFEGAQHFVVCGHSSSNTQELS